MNKPAGQENRKVHVYKVHFHYGDRLALGEGQCSVQPLNVTCRRCKASAVFIAARNIQRRVQP